MRRLLREFVLGLAVGIIVLGMPSSARAQCWGSCGPTMMAPECTINDCYTIDTFLGTANTGPPCWVCYIFICQAYIYPMFEPGPCFVCDQYLFREWCGPEA